MSAVYYFYFVIISVGPEGSVYETIRYLYLLDSFSLIFCEIILFWDFFRFFFKTLAKGEAINFENMKPFFGEFLSNIAFVFTHQGYLLFAMGEVGRALGV